MKKHKNKANIEQRKFKYILLLKASFKYFTKGHCLCLQWHLSIEKIYFCPLDFNNDDENVFILYSSTYSSNLSLKQGCSHKRLTRGLHKISKLPLSCNQSCNLNMTRVDVFSRSLVEQPGTLTG